MIIRQFEHKDYGEVLALLRKTGVEPPAEPSDFNGVALVAVEGEKIIGCVWALVGLSSQAYVDYCAVDPEYRKSHVAWSLVRVLDEILRRAGVKRYTFFVEPENDYVAGLMERLGKENRVTRLRDLLFYRREIS